MKVFLRSIGDLRDYFGRDLQEIDLDEKATLQDVLITIDNRWGDILPGYLWDASSRRFRGPVFFLINKEVVQDLDTPLQDGLQIDLIRALVGGCLPLEKGEIPNEYYTN
jgi:sulfur carrier protein ThiS